MSSSWFQRQKSDGLGSALNGSHMDDSDDERLSYEERTPTNDIILLGNTSLFYIPNSGEVTSTGRPQNGNHGGFRQNLANWYNRCGTQEENNHQYVQRKVKSMRDVIVCGRFKPWQMVIIVMVLTSIGIFALAAVIVHFQVKGTINDIQVAFKGVAFKDGLQLQRFDTTPNNCCPLQVELALENNGNVGLRMMEAKTVRLEVEDEGQWKSIVETTFPQVTIDTSESVILSICKDDQQVTTCSDLAGSSVLRNKILNGDQIVLGISYIEDVKISAKIWGSYFPVIGAFECNLRENIVGLRKAISRVDLSNFAFTSNSKNLSYTAIGQIINPSPFQVTIPPLSINLSVSNETCVKNECLSTFGTLSNPAFLLEAQSARSVQVNGAITEQGLSSIVEHLVTGAPLSVGSATGLANLGTDFVFHFPIVGKLFDEILVNALSLSEINASQYSLQAGMHATIHSSFGTLPFEVKELKDISMQVISASLGMIGIVTGSCVASIKSFQNVMEIQLQFQGLLIIPPIGSQGFEKYLEAVVNGSSPGDLILNGTAAMVVDSSGMSVEVPNLRIRVPLIFPNWDTLTSFNLDAIQLLQSITNTGGVRGTSNLFFYNPSRMTLQLLGGLSINTLYKNATIASFFSNSPFLFSSEDQTIALSGNFVSTNDETNANDIGEFWSNYMNENVQYVQVTAQTVRSNQYIDHALRTLNITTLFNGVQLVPNSSIDSRGVHLRLSNQVSS